ncbi:MAG: lipase family protein [Gammaproteobacteria bacterium]
MTHNHSFSESQRSARTCRADACGFVADEARQLLEFCIELNDQDDRNTHPEDSEFKPHFGSWVIEYDSRNGLGTDPAQNGFGPFENAWILLRNQDKPGDYALAIRGTIGQAKSILDDFLATTISARAGIEFPKQRILPVTFAVTPGAEVHLGFAYAAFTLLFDKDRGILSVLRSGLIPGGAGLMITGHSQGAAIATLVHAFLHYGVSDPGDRYGLQSKQLALKSYVFAQPKPGNYQFAMDFAQIAGSRGAGFVVNNSLDPVTLLPLSRETLSESISGTLEENQMQGMGVKGILIKGAGRLSRTIFKLRNLVAEGVGDKLAKFYHQKEMQNIDTRYFAGISSEADTPVKSLNYTLCGALIPLFGEFKGGSLYPPRQEGEVDVLLQHHATTYRKLLRRQLADPS